MQPNATAGAVMIEVVLAAVRRAAEEKEANRGRTRRTRRIVRSTRELRLEIGMQIRLVCSCRTQTSKSLPPAWLPGGRW